MAGTQTDGTQDSDLTVAGAADAMFGLLSLDEDAQDDAEVTEEEAPEDETAADADATDEDEATDEDSGEEDSEASEEQKPDQPKLHKVTIDGEEIEVTEAELLKGYSRTADYTRKTQALAAARREFEEKELSAVRQEREQYATHLTQLEAALKAVTEPDWTKIRKERPGEFPALFAEWQVHAEQVKQVEAERAKTQAKISEDQQRAFQAAVRQEQEALRAAVPEWQADEGYQQGLKELVAYGRKAGFTDEELGSLVDHRLVLLLRKAALHDRGVASKTEAVKKKVAVAGKVTKPGAAKAVVPEVKQKAHRARLKQSGSLDDAAALLEGMLG